MLEIKRSSSICIIVLHEIYGINQHIKEVCEALAEHGFDVICPDLLGQGTVYDYTQEEIAYRNFMNRSGFKNSRSKVNELAAEIQQEYSKIFLLGFSVGATVAWLCSEEEYVDGIVGYYGSRIRDYTDIKPACPALLYFPNVEKSFDVSEVVLTLDQPNLDVRIYEGEHGFGDPQSPAYNEKLAGSTFKQTLNFFHNK